MTEWSIKQWLTVCVIQQGRIIDDFLARRVSSPWQRIHYYPEATPPSRSQTNGQPAVKNTTPSIVGMAEAKKRMLNVPLQMWLTQTLLFTDTVEICIFLPLPLLILFFPLHVPTYSPTILPACEGSAWSGYYPTLLLWYWSASSSALSSFLFSLHRPLHWFFLPLWARQLGVITQAAHIQCSKHTQTASKEGDVQPFFAIKAIKLSDCRTAWWKHCILSFKGSIDWKLNLTYYHIKYGWCTVLANHEPSGIGVNMLRYLYTAGAL